MEDPNVYLGNPINAYLFVKKFTLDWETEVQNAVKNDPSYGNSIYIRNIILYGGFQKGIFQPWAFWMPTSGMDSSELDLFF